MADPMTRLLPLRTLALLAVSLVAVIGCKNDTSGTAAAAGGKVKLQLNWKPEPQFGGFYAAALDGGPFKAAGLDVEVVAGGAGTPTVQMVGAGQVDFAVVSADQVVLARSNGNDVVALLAVFQDCPQGLMTRASRGFTQIGDVFRNPGTVAMEKGLPYARLLQQQYGFDKVQVVPSPGGSLAQFQADPTFTQQCFVTSEPLAAEKAGIKVKTFLVKDAGYNPYTTVLVTRGEVVKKNPKLALAVATACRQGWEAYLKDPAPANAAMQKLNPSVDAETFAAGAKVQEPLILTAETKAGGLGVMTLGRWETLVKQLAESEVKGKAPPAGECFVDLKALEGAAAAGK
jgi:NitT/TauT family transport system substrate-binding protein